MTLPATCLDCGLPYEQFPMDVILPRAQWLEIHPDDGGLLCASCIVTRASQVPRATCCHLIIEIAPLVGAGECICRTRGCRHSASLHRNGVCEVCNAGLCWS